jgi:hypothetical protein
MSSGSQQQSRFRIRTCPAHELIADVDDKRVWDALRVDPLALVVGDLERGHAVLAEDGEALKVSVRTDTGHELVNLAVTEGGVE